MSRDKERVERHPSYGLVSFSRRQGNPGTLFGSALNNHHSYITLSIRKGEKVIDDTGSERFYGQLRDGLMEVDLSPSQFAELLTTMNVGMGVPCTIRYLNGEEVQKPPPLQMEIQNIREALATEFQKAAARFKDGRKVIEGLLEKKTPLTREDKVKIREVIAISDRLLLDTSPYLMTLFQEATEKVVTHAKAEIDSVLTHNIFSEGLKSFARKAASMIPQLGTGDVDSE